MISVLVGAVVVAVAVAAVLVLRRRAPRTPAIDPFTLSERWRRHMTAALAAQRRYREIVRTTSAGPLRTHMEAIGRQVQQAVLECWGIARRGDEIDELLDSLDTTSLAARARDTTASPETQASLAAQLASAERIRATRDDTDAQLHLLTTRMGELVTQAAEVAAASGDLALGDELGAGVGEVVTELEALRLAVDDINNTGRPTTSP